VGVLRVVALVRDLVRQHEHQEPYLFYKVRSLQEQSELLTAI
jgi:hypothetical protein